MNRANLMLLGAVTLWGLTVVPMKWAMETIHPFTLMFLRYWSQAACFSRLPGNEEQRQLGLNLPRCH